MVSYMFKGGSVSPPCNSYMALTNRNFPFTLSNNHMLPDLVSFSLSQSLVAHKLCPGRMFHRFNCAVKIAAFTLSGLVVYVTFFSPRGSSWRIANWHLPSRFGPDSILDDISSTSLSPSPASDVLTPEQIRDIVAPTRGFYSRDYSLHLGWNNVSTSLEFRYQQ